MDHLRIENAVVHVDKDSQDKQVVTIFAKAIDDNLKTIQELNKVYIAFSVSMIGNTYFILWAKVNPLLNFCYEVPIEKYKELFSLLNFTVATAMLEQRHKDLLARQ